MCSNSICVGYSYAAGLFCRFSARGCWATNLTAPVDVVVSANVRSVDEIVLVGFVLVGFVLVGFVLVGFVLGDVELSSRKVLLGYSSWRLISTLFKTCLKRLTECGERFQRQVLPNVSLVSLHTC